MAAIPEFKYQAPFPLGPDDTEYYLLTKDYVSVSEFEGKPILKIESDGKLVNFAKKRTAKMAMSALVSFYNESADRSGDEHVFIVHSDNPEGAEFLKSEVASVSPDSRIDIVQLSPIIAAHTGPGLCAVIHFSREEAKRG